MKQIRNRHIMIKNAIPLNILKQTGRLRGRLQFLVVGGPEVPPRPAHSFAEIWS